MNGLSLKGLNKLKMYLLDNLKKSLFENAREKLLPPSKLRYFTYETRLEYYINDQI